MSEGWKNLSPKGNERAQSIELIRRSLRCDSAALHEDLPGRDSTAGLPGTEEHCEDQQMGIKARHTPIKIEGLFFP